MQLKVGQIRESVSGDWWMVLGEPHPSRQVHCVRVKCDVTTDGAIEKEVLWDAMTETRGTPLECVRMVMRKVAADLNAFVVAGLLTADLALKWINALIHIQVAGELEYFEFQLDGFDFGYEVKLGYGHD